MNYNATRQTHNMGYKKVGTYLLKVECIGYLGDQQSNHSKCIEV